MKTFSEAKKELRDIGMTLTRNDGEYRVNALGARESTAYYTTDLHDAVATGYIMRYAR